MIGLEMMQHTAFTVMRDYINNAPIVNYGIVLEVYSQKSVKVAVMSSIEETTIKLDCSVLFTSSSHLEVSHKLEVGDKGLILSLQHSAKDIFSAEKPLTKEGRKGYSVFSCVFIPYNTLKGAEETTTKLTLDEERILLETKVPVIVDAEEVHLCGDTKNFVSHAELDSSLQAYAGAIQAEMASITAAAATAIASGGYWTQPLTSIGAATIDISSSKATKVKTS